MKEHNQEFYDGRNKEMIDFMKSPDNEKGHYYNYKWIVKHTKEGDQILDVGCGTGTLSYMLNKEGRFPTGIDISQVSIDFCKDKIKGHMFHKMDANNIQLNDGLFDVVASNQLLEHVKEPEKVIKEMLRLLKPSGKLLITVPINKELDVKDKDIGHINHWRFYDLMRLFEKFGDNFKIFWINKFTRVDEEGNVNKKNVFAVRFING